MGKNGNHYDKSKIWFYQSLPIKDDRIWECNTSTDDIKKLVPLKVNHMSAVRSVWLAWSEYNYVPTYEDTDEMLSAVMWGNSLIRRRNKPIFDGDFVNSNIERILDIYNFEENSFFTYCRTVKVTDTEPYYIRATSRH